MFLVRFKNAIGPQSVYATKINITDNALYLDTEVGDTLYYTPIGKVTVQTIKDW